ncbi:hypothetical protein CJP74_07605 [Psittacicella melopsittaci]|uniref:Uncharacterized protein n=1 Tax=Psittacicella melopsittaci TaxID=2028576 RepID=A0A3A1XZC9_9GAMM|nr:hypothetical protein CJP74_07605 [Psittacicella melopsittaci]
MSLQAKKKLGTVCSASDLSQLKYIHVSALFIEVKLNIPREKAKKHAKYFIFLKKQSLKKKILQKKRS